MPTITEIRDAVAAKLSTIEGLRVHARVPESIAVPAAIVAPDSGTFLTYDSTMSGDSDDYTFIITLLVSRASERAGQVKLDGYLARSGPASVKAAIEADGADLDGVVDSVSVTEARNHSSILFADISYLGCEFVVRVDA